MWNLREGTNYNLKEFSSYHLSLARIYVSSTSPELAALILKCNSLPQAVRVLEKELSREPQQVFQPDIDTSTKCAVFLDWGEKITGLPINLACYTKIMKCNGCSYRHDAYDLRACPPVTVKPTATTSPAVETNDPVERDLQELLQMLKSPRSDLIPAKISPEAERPLDNIHCGFYRPIKDEANGKEYYMLVFLDEYTRFATPYFCTDKSPSTLMQKFKDFKVRSERLHSDSGYHIRRVITYRTPTFIGKFSDFLSKGSIVHSDTSCTLDEQFV